MKTLHMLTMVGALGLATQGLAQDPVEAEPVTPPLIIQEDTEAASSSSGILVPLLLLALVAAVAVDTSSNSP